MRARSFALSLVLQTLGVLLILAVPLLRPEGLPKGLVNFVSITAPPGRPAAPPPPELARTARPAPQRPLAARGLTVPARIPVLQQFIDPIDVPSGPSVPWSTGPWVPNSTGSGPASDIAAQIAPAPTTPVPPPDKGSVLTTKRIVHITVGGNVQEALITHKVTPVYPPLAKQTRVSGTVRFTAVIGRDGTVQGLTLVAGNPLLVAAAADAVRQWRYRPTLLNGDPVEVVTTIDVRFILN